MAVRESLLDNSPGLGRVGSFRLRGMATCEGRRSLGMRPRRGDPLLLSEDLLDSFAAFVTAVAAREMDELRGEGVWLRFGGRAAVCMARGCMGDDEVDLE